VTCQVFIYFCVDLTLGALGHCPAFSAWLARAFSSRMLCPYGERPIRPSERRGRQTLACPADEFGHARVLSPLWGPEGHAHRFAAALRVVALAAGCIFGVGLSRSLITTAIVGCADCNDVLGVP
jgi:hypothetical protein